MAHTPTAALRDAGVSIWLDDLSRKRIEDGSLVDLITSRDVVGVTTNPTIFAAAIGHGIGYEDRIAECARRGLNAQETVFELTTQDVADACDIFADVYTRTGGEDGRVSIEVEPGLAHDADATTAQARELWARVGKPNAMIKIPATEAGLIAIADTIAEGISVNVTLIFSLERYREVINAYLGGLERARVAGHDLSQIRSVASFFISRLDTEIDRRLRSTNTDEALTLTGIAGVANARLAYEVFRQGFSTARAEHLLALGAHVQRPLWASTGVKDPALPDTMYVTELVAPHVVNTMPAATLEAVADHAKVTGDTVTDNTNSADQALNAIDGQGIDYVEVTELLEREGLEKFQTSWDELLDIVDRALKAAR